MAQNPWPRVIEDLIARVRAGETQALVDIDRELESPEQPARTRSVLRSLRAFCLMQSGHLSESAAEAAALLPFAQRHDHHDTVAQCYRVLAMECDMQGDQRGRHEAQRLAIAAAERSGDALLLGRVGQEFALTLGENGRYDHAAEILLQHWRDFDWEDSNEAFFGVSLAANLGWALNMAGRPEEALAAASIPPKSVLVGNFGAALSTELWRARHALGHPQEIEALEAVLAESLQEGWSLVSANVHLLLSQQYPANSAAARTHATLALNVEGLQRSYWRESILRRSAECARAQGDEEQADSLEREAQGIREAALAIQDAEAP